MNLLRRNSSNQKEIPASVPLERHNEVESHLRAANDDNRALRALREKIAVLEEDNAMLKHTVDELDKEVAQLKQKVSELEAELDGPFIGL